jgi:branched-chain amino acid transport system substrate-binding protein
VTPRTSLPYLLLFLAAACGGSADEVRFGMAGPFTESFGVANRRGAELAVEEINAAGGIGGRRLVIDYRDDQGDGARAARVAQEFVDEPAISAVVGHVSSGAMVAAAKVYDGSLAAVATTASSPELTGISPWVFRVISSDSVNAIDLARFAQRLGKRRAAILYENDAYGRGLADGFRRNFEGEVLLTDPIDASASGADVHIAWFVDRRPDLVFVAGTEMSALALLREARAQGLQADFLGGDGWTSVLSDPVVAEGALIGAPFTPFDPRPRAQQFVAAYRARFDQDPDANAALAYDAVFLLANAVREAGTGREAIRDWLAARTPERAFEGVTGSIAFLPSGDPVGKAFTMTRVTGGRLTLAEDRR